MSASSSQALEYLEQLPRQTHTKLYEQPSTVLAIYRCMLPHIAKSIVMAMLYMPGPFSSADLDVWFRPDAKKEKEKTFSVLEGLHILVPVVDDARNTSYSLYKSFQRSLRQALEGSGTHGSFGVPASQPDPEKVDIAFLDEYARTRWEDILFYMVGGTVGMTSLGHDLSKGTKTLLNYGDLVRSRPGAKTGFITAKGFTFVLQETNAQVWNLLILYLKCAPSLEMEATDVLSFLFMLGSLELGQDYTTSTLNTTQLRLLNDLSDFGIVYRRHANSATFYPTRLAVSLTSDAGALTATSSRLSNAPSDATEKGFIIVETNYRLYAYTNSLLQIAILSLFTRLNTRFPNLVSGKITKESITRAVKHGISSSQILAYLSAHAHPQMETGLPPTVSDQIKLWEYEGERVEVTNGYLMKEFSTANEYRELVGYAESLGVLVWRDDETKVCFVNRMDQIKVYLARKAEGKQGG